MALLEVDTDRLRTVAAQCEFLAAAVAGTGTVVAVGLGRQATTSAISAVHTDIDTTVESLVRRLRSNADILTTATAAYGANEFGSAVRLSDVTAEV